jgi:hypothetical protein
MSSAQLKKVLLVVAAVCEAVAGQIDAPPHKMIRVKSTRTR